VTEPTESGRGENVDRFADAMGSTVREAALSPGLFREAPVKSNNFRIGAAILAERQLWKKIEKGNTNIRQGL
jgi:glycine cleavage system protein P-like pyridoxal-binding family